MKALITFGLLCLFINDFAQTSHKFELIDVFDIEYISDPQISPNGEKIVYVRNFKDIMTDRDYSNLWIVNFDGTENRPLTTGNQNDFYPRWSNDGTKIIYKSGKDGSVQIYLRWMESNHEAKLSNVQFAPNDISWSPDDKYLAFNMFVPKSTPSPIKLPPKPPNAEWNNPPVYIDRLKYRANGTGYLKQGNRQLFIISTEGGSPRQITSGNHDHGAPVWSTHSGNLFFSANLRKDSEYHPFNSEIYRINIQTGSIDSLTNRYGPDFNPRISPDGKHIAYLGFDDLKQAYQITNAYLMDVDGEKTQLISGDFDRDVRGICWNKDSKGLYFLYDDQGNTKIAYLTLTGKITDLTNNVGGLSLGRPYSAGTFTATPKGKYAYTLTGTNHPADLASGEQSNTKRLTDYNKDLFSHKNLGDVEEIWYKSSYDGRNIQAWIVKPPDFDSDLKYPLILEIHGGPVANYGTRFSAEMQLYAACGYVVLYVNPRGSTSYGQEFGNLIHQNYPGQDYDDLMSGVDAVIEKGYVDEKNLFVTGGSGGGILSAWIIGNTDRFNAAVVVKPITNWYSFVFYTDIVFWASRWFSDYPWKVPDEYMKRSPISLVDNVTTPTMILTGEQDFRTPIAESEQYYTALKLRKVEASLVRIPDASHSIASRPSNLIAKVSAILTWFDQYKVVTDMDE